MDGLHYEFQIDYENHVTLALVGGRSPKYSPPSDPFDWDWRPAVTDDLGNSRFPVTVLRHAYRLLEQWIRREKPGYFCFAGLTEKRRQLYRRVSRLVSRRFPYHTLEKGEKFWFYRLADKRLVGGGES